MTDQPYKRSAIDILLLVLWAFALIGLVMDLVLDPYWLEIASSLFLFIGLGAAIQWRRYRSRRWRTIAWISFVLAFTALLLRMGEWTGWSGE